ncbi:MAG: hypothetical protein ACK5KQ_04755 [Anaerorhabdus sp.]
MLKLLKPDETRSFIYTIDGLSLYAVKMRTALKFHVKNNKEEVVERLMGIFDELGYPDVLKPSYFTITKEFFNDELDLYYNGLKTVTIGSLILALILLFSQIQFVSLYMIENHREITVKKYLGFKRFDIYKKLLMIWNIIFLISTRIVMIMEFFINVGYLPIFIMIMSIFYVISIIIIWLITSNFNKKI